MLLVTEHELLQVDILFALEREGLLNELTFQGGAALLLCGGADRFSEDLYFAGDQDFTNQDMDCIKQCLEDYVGRRYQLKVVVKGPEEQRRKSDDAGIHVDKWEVSVVAASAQRDLPRQQIKLKLANVPAYTREARNLNIHYPFLPDGYRDFLIVAETLDEIMAEWRSRTARQQLTIDQAPQPGPSGNTPPCGGWLGTRRPRSRSHAPGSPSQ